MSFNSSFGMGLGIGWMFNNVMRKSYERNYPKELAKARAKLEKNKKL